MIVLPFPPSANHYWRHLTSGKLAGRTLISAEGRVFREQVMRNAQAERWPSFNPDQRLSVRILAYMPDKRRRDLDNLLKSALDALTHAGVWADDSQIDSLLIERAATLGGMLKVEVEARP
jgi:crossover junction endodeoxyribonuclease RusA